jgi:hypothetical protein
MSRKLITGLVHFSRIHLSSGGVERRFVSGGGTAVMRGSTMIKVTQVARCLSCDVILTARGRREIAYRQAERGEQRT